MPVTPSSFVGRWWRRLRNLGAAEARGEELAAAKPRRRRRSLGGATAADADPFAALLAPAVLEPAAEPPDDAAVERVARNLLAQVKTSTARDAPYPASASLIGELLSGEPDLNPVVRLVSRDPAIVAALLRAANSVEHARGQAHTDVRSAVLALGMRQVKQTALAIASQGLFDHDVGVDGDTVAQFLRMRKRALITAFSASWLDQHRGGLGHDILFVAGMFLDVGIPVTLRAAAMWPELGSIPPDIVAAAVDRIHVTVGVSTQRSWRLPSRSIELCQHHHGVDPVIGLNELPLLRLAAAMVELRVAAAPAPRTVAVARAAAAQLGLDGHAVRAFATAIDEQATAIGRLYRGGDEPATWRPS